MRDQLLIILGIIEPDNVTIDIKTRKINITSLLMPVLLVCFVNKNVSTRISNFPVVANLSTCTHDYERERVQIKFRSKTAGKFRGDQTERKRADKTRGHWGKERGRKAQRGWKRAREKRGEPCKRAKGMAQPVVGETFVLEGKDYVCE